MEEEMERGGVWGGGEEKGICSPESINADCEKQ